MRAGASAEPGIDLEVGWPSVPGVGAGMTTRAGGVSAAPFDSLNLADHVGDDDASVRRNRESLACRLGVQPHWLRQVHGASVVELEGAAEPDEPREADGCWTTRPGVACAVLVADCLPVLFAARNGRAVGAAHAGWRGLAAGVVERTLGCVASAAGCEPAAVQAWLGPCIGPRRFEVGEEVVRALGGGPRFAAQGERAGRARWLADLAGLARDRLHRAGVGSVSGGSWCTVEDASRFFSFRREGRCGRMAGLVWLEPR